MSRYIFFISILYLAGCDFASTPKRITGNYFLSEIDGETDISYNLKEDQFVGVVGPQILEVGYSSEFIIAKKMNVIFGEKKSGGEIEYFIIPIKDKVAAFPDDNKIGPLKEADFIEKLNQLGISSIKFTIKIEG